MAVDLLTLVTLLGLWWLARRFAEPDPGPAALPFDDQPPVTAVGDHPRRRRWEAYVEQGFDEIDLWLHHRDEAA